MRRKDFIFARSVPPRRQSFASNPTRLPLVWRNSALSLPLRSPSKPLPISRGAQPPPCDSFLAGIPDPMTPVWTGSCSQNPAPVPGDSGGRVPLIVPLVLPGSTSEIPFLRLPGVVERPENSPRLFSCGSINCFPPVFRGCGFVQTPFLAEGHEKSNIERDSRQAEHRYGCAHSESNLPARLSI